MKTLLALAAVILTTTCAVQAENVRGHFRSNGTYVQPYYRTPANDTPYDNLSYRGYPSQERGYVSPRKSGFDSDYGHIRTLPTYGGYDGGLQTLPSFERTYKIRPLAF